MIKECVLYNIKTILDERGNISIIENHPDMFNIKRVFYIYNVPNNLKRGCHAHKETQQCLIPISGNFDIYVNNGSENAVYKMNNPQIGLIIKSKIWNELFNFSNNAVCLVLASQEYDLNDYIVNYTDFLNMAKGEIL